MDSSIAGTYNRGGEGDHVEHVALVELNDLIHVGELLVADGIESRANLLDHVV